MYLLAFADPVQLFPDGTIVIHIALILVMIWVLNRTFFKPINRVIASREINKGGKSGEAISILKDVETKQARYTQEMLAARSSGYELIEKEQKEAAAAREQQVAAAKTEVAIRFDASKAELEKQRAEARSTIGTDAEKIADQIAASILRA